MVTLLAAVENGGTNIADLSGCLTCVDLVGTGWTEGCEFMSSLGFNDEISMFFWRNVDLNMGVVELFDANDFTGRRTTLFLSEWEPGKVHDINRWQLQDTISSVRWKTLQDRQTVILYDAMDGSPTHASYGNIKGWGSTKEVARLVDFRMNDCVSSFRWDSVNPVKEIIAPFVISAGNSSSDRGLTSLMTGHNNTSEIQPVTVSLNDSTSQTVTVETSDQHIFGVTASFSQTATAGVEGIASSQTQVSISDLLE